MSPAEQRLLLAAWKAYRQGRRVSNELLVAFYFDVVKHLPMARYGMAYEVFDLIINGPFEPAPEALARFRGGRQPACGKADAAPDALPRRCAG